MIDFSKTAEEIKEELILEFLFLKQHNKDYGWAGMNSYMATQCAIIMVKGMIQVCPEEITELSGDFYVNPDYSKLVQVLELLEK